MTLEQHQQHSDQPVPFKKQDNSRDSKQLFLPFAYQPLPFQFGYQIIPSNEGNPADAKSYFNPAAALLSRPQPLHFLYKNAQQQSFVSETASDNYIGLLLKKSLFETHPLRKSLDQSASLAYFINRKVDELRFQDKLDVLNEYYSTVSYQDGEMKKSLSEVFNQHGSQKGEPIGLFRSGNKGIASKVDDYFTKFEKEHAAQ